MHFENHCGLDNWTINNYVYSTARTFEADRQHAIFSGCGSPTRLWNYKNHHNIYYIQNFTALTVFKPWIAQVLLH